MRTAATGATVEELDMQIETLKTTLRLIREGHVKPRRFYRILSGRLIIEMDAGDPVDLIKDEIARLQAWKNKLETRG